MESRGIPIIHPKPGKWYRVQPTESKRAGVTLYKRPHPEPFHPSGIVMVAYAKLLKIPSGSLVFFVEEADILNHGHVVGYQEYFGILMEHNVKFHEIDPESLEEALPC